MAEITLPVFQGPLDLLLHLIERDDLDITAVSLVTVTDQYLRAIRTGEGFDPQALAEFVSVGAKLIYLKSKALLPRAPQEDGEGLDDDDVGRELVDLLREYKRFAEVADMLEERQDEGTRIYTRLAPPPEQPEGSGLHNVTMERLRAIMLEVLNKKPPEPRVRAVIVRDTTMTLGERLCDFRERLQRRGRFSFRRMMLECTTRVDVVVSFMAVLELVRSGECDAEQDAAWGDIVVVALVRAG
ncbi:MAG: segregation/condensation protein A [Tepidiformaceae bacterium]